ncbi:MAG: SMP-30/gluconolactonase/LRE family protein [Caulobacteraceae bacterium]|nr:SMP-30/gluconolactonase/LRE family protein [Caulobacteraceae bacterium]
MELANVRLVTEGLRFPEGPVALSDGSVVLVELTGKRITRVFPNGEKQVVAEVGGGPNGAAIGPDGALYVCNNGGRNNSGSIQRVDLDSGAFETLYTEAEGQPLAAPNDLVFDETGNFWFTDYHGGAICYAAPDGSRVVRAVTDAAAPNGVGLSPDGRTLYWAQTYSRQVMLRRLSGPGQVIARPAYGVHALAGGAELDPDVLLAGMPGARELDSLAIDSSGAVCVGTLVDSGVTVISPDGRSVELLTLPAAFKDQMVTNICFGGEDLKTAFITCSQTGRLIACDWPRPGLRLAYNR